MCAVEFAAWALCCLQVKLFLIHDVFMNSNGFTCIEQCVNQGTHLACIWVVSNGSWSQRRQIQNFSDFSFQNWYCLWLFWLQLPTYKWLNLNAGIHTLDFNFTVSALPPKSAKMLVSMCLQLFVCVSQLLPPTMIPPQSSWPCWSYLICYGQLCFTLFTEAGNSFHWSDAM